MFYHTSCIPCDCKMFYLYITPLTCNCRIFTSLVPLNCNCRMCFTFYLAPLCNCKLVCTNCLHQGGQKPVLSLSLDHITEYSTWCHLFFFFFFLFFFWGGGVSPSILHLLRVIAEGFTCLVPLNCNCRWFAIYLAPPYLYLHIVLSFNLHPLLVTAVFHLQSCTPNL